MGHDHDHCGHNHSTTSFNAYKQATTIGAVAFVLQSILVFVSGSLALRGDTIHLASDCTYLAANLFIVWQTNKMRKPRGDRLRTIAALLGIMLLAFGAWNVYWVAQERIAQSVTVGTGWMLAGGLLGFGANALMYRALHTSEPVNYVILEHGSGRLMKTSPPRIKKHVQDRVVEAHVLSDLAGSFVVVTSATISLLWGFDKLDSYSGVLLAAFMVFLCISSVWKIARGEPIH